MDSKKKLDTFLKVFEKLTKKLNSQGKKTIELREGFLSSTKKKDFLMRATNFSHKDFNKIENMTLKDLDKLHSGLKKTEEALENIENSTLPRLARSLYSVQGGLFSALGDIAMFFGGPIGYVAIQVLKEFYNLVMQGDRANVDSYKTYYTAMGEAGEYATGIHQDVPKLITRLEYLANEFGLSKEVVRSSLNAFAKSGGKFNLSGALTKNLAILKDKVLRPAMTLGTLFNIDTPEMAGLLGQMEFDSGTSALSIRRKLVTFYGNLDGLSSPIQNHLNTLKEVEANFSHFGGVSMDTISFISKVIIEAKGSKYAQELIGKLKFSEGDSDRNFLILSTSLEGDDNTEYREELKLKIESKNLTKDTRESTFAEEAISILNGLEKGKKMREGDVLVLQKFIEPDAFYVKLLDNLVSSIGSGDFPGVTIESATGLTELDFLHLKEAIKVGLNEDNPDYAYLESLAKNLNTLQMSATDYLEYKISHLKLELTLPAIKYITDSLMGFFNKVLGSEIGKTIYGDLKLDLSPYVDLDEKQRELYEKSIGDSLDFYSRKGENYNYKGAESDFRSSNVSLSSTKKLSTNLLKSYQLSKSDNDLKQEKLNEIINRLNEIAPMSHRDRASMVEWQFSNKDRSLESSGDLGKLLSGLVKSDQDLSVLNKHFYDKADEYMRLSREWYNNRRRSKVTKKYLITHDREKPVITQK